MATSCTGVFLDCVYQLLYHTSDQVAPDLVTKQVILLETEKPTPKRSQIVLGAADRSGPFPGLWDILHILPDLGAGASLLAFLFPRLLVLIQE